RVLAIDDDVSKRWLAAFEHHETRCEKLGALHLLSHGVYAFKADAYTGRTDLILGETPSTEDIQAAAALVLTEWKLVRDGEDHAAKAVEGQIQARRYANVELGAFELRTIRYVVLVSREPIKTLTDQQEGDVTYRFINVAIVPGTPSTEARRS